MQSTAAIAARLSDAALYKQDRAAWAKVAAPRWYKRMRRETEAEKRESWRIAGPELRAAIRHLIEQESTHGPV